jgi:uncharacterized protein (DUF924 family)
MYAGDEAARWQVYEGLARGHDAGLSLEERMFFLMPLGHSELIQDQERGVALARELARHAPPVLREAFDDGVAHALDYHSTIARFGRFPHRNAVLDRTSTPEEIAFLDRKAAAA